MTFNAKSEASDLDAYVVQFPVLRQMSYVPEVMDRCRNVSGRTSTCHPFLPSRQTQCIRTRSSIASHNISRMMEMMIIVQPMQAKVKEARVSH
jgi:hypothetical protein